MIISHCDFHDHMKSPYTPPAINPTGLSEKSTSSPHSRASFSLPFAAFQILKNCYCQPHFQNPVPQYHVCAHDQNISLHPSTPRAFQRSTAPSLNPLANQDHVNLSPTSESLAVNPQKTQVTQSAVRIVQSHKKGRIRLNTVYFRRCTVGGGL